MKIKPPNKIEKIKCYLIYMICLFFFSQTFAQTITVSGKVSASRYTVKQALVTFISSTDTTNKVSTLTDNAGNYQVNVVTSLSTSEHSVSNFSLAQNYPNPFSSSTAIAYKLKKQSDARVTIYDVLGREVRKFTLGVQTLGSHKIVWDGKNQAGARVASGIYFYRLQIGSKSLVKKMIYSSDFNNVGIIDPGFLPKSESGSEALKINLQQGMYIIRVENTENTIPFIKSLQIENVPIQNDTTVNISVEYNLTASVRPDSVRQIIRGFGASNILFWRQDMTNSEIQTAFGTGEGQLGFTILRLMIEPDKSRWNLYVPTAKKAHDMGVTIIASPWYAPGDMVESVNGVSRVRHNKYAEYAAHLDSFVTYMANNDVPLYGISIQNEPDITNQWTSWTADEIFTFMKENADAINGTRVMTPESFHFDRGYSDPILNDSAACANTDVICGHIYGGGVAPYPLAEEKGKEVWMTEYLINSGNPPSDLNIDTGWTGAMQTAKSISDCMNADMNAYVWWYIVRYYGPIADGTYATKGQVTKKGYVMSQFSRFIRPGDHRVESAVYPPSGSVSVTAYRDSLSSKLVLVAVNSGSSPVDIIVALHNGTMNSYTPYITSASENVVKGDDTIISSNPFTISLEGSSITTFILQ